MFARRRALSTSTRCSCDPAATGATSTSSQRLLQVSKVVVTVLFLRLCLCLRVLCGSAQRDNRVVLAGWACACVPGSVQVFVGATTHPVPGDSSTYQWSSEPMDAGEGLRIARGDPAFPASGLFYVAVRSMSDS